MANNTPLRYGDYSFITQPVTYSPRVEHNYHNFACFKIR